MASGHAVGTLFAEIDLDWEPYSRSQKKLLQDATSTTTNIEKSYKDLGIKSAQEFDLMRAKISNAYERITSDAKTSAADILRAEQAKDAALTKINEQQFGKQTTFLENIKANWLAYSAAAYAAIKLIKSGWDLMESAASYQERINSLDALGAQYDLTGQQIVDAMKAASRGLVSMSEAADMAASALNLSLTPDQMIEFTRVSEAMTDVIGGTVPEAFNRMTVAAASGRTQTLAQMGIIVDLDQAYKDYAATLGRSAKDLSESEKQQVRLNAILEEAKEKVDVLGPATDTAADKMERMAKAFDDAKLAIGLLVTDIVMESGILTALKSILELTRDVTTALNNMFELPSTAVIAQAHISKLSSQIAELKENISQGDSVVEFLYGSEDEANKKLAELQANLKQAQDIVDQSFGGMATSHIQIIDEIKTAHSNYVADVITKTKEKSAAELKIEAETAEEYKKIIKSALDYQEAQDTEREKVLEAMASKEIEIAEDTKKELKKILESQSKYEEQQNEEREEALERFGEKTEDVFEEITKESKGAVADFVDGWKLGYKESIEDAKTWAEAGKSTFEDFYNAATSSLADFFNPLKDEFLDVEALWDSMLDSMLDSLTTTVAEMAVNWALTAGFTAISSFFKHEGDWDIGSDEYPAILQAGEIVVPADTSEKIRDAMEELTGGSGYSFDSLASAVEAAAALSGADLSDPALSAALGAFTRSVGIDAASIGVAALDYGASFSQYIGALLSTTLPSSSISGALVGLEAGMGFPATKMSTLGSIAGGIMLGPAGAVLGHLIATLGWDLAMDAFDERDQEPVKDLFEEAYGWFGGHQAYSDFMNSSLVSDVFLAESLQYPGWTGEDLLNAVGSYLGDYGFSGNLDDYVMGMQDMNPQTSPVDVTFAGDTGGSGDDTPIGRTGGWFNGPMSGHTVELHGKELVLNEDQVRAIRELNAGGSSRQSPVAITLTLDKKVLSQAIYDTTKSGKKIINSRGIK